METVLKSNKMTTTISDLRMEPAKNGVIISYCQKTQKSGSKGTYDNCSYDYPKEVFDFEDGEDGEDKGLEQAFTRFKELFMQQYKEVKGKL